MKKEKIFLISIPMFLILIAILIALIYFMVNKKINDEQLVKKLEKIEWYNKIENKILIMMSVVRNYFITEKEEFLEEYKQLYRELINEINIYKNQNGQNGFLNADKICELLIKKNEKIEDLIKNRTNKILILEYFYTQRDSLVSTLTKEIESADISIYQYFDKIIEDNRKYDKIFSGIILSLVIILIIYAFLIILWFIRLNKSLTEKNIEIENKNRELVNLNSLKDKFFSIVAHDLRSPFGSILGFIDLLSEEINNCKENSNCKYFIETIKNSSKTYFGFLESLLMWSRAQFSQIAIKIEKINLFTLFFEIKEIYKQTLINKKISLVIDCDNEEIIESDYNILNTVIRNLVNNAIKFTKEGGTITIKSEKENKRIIVKDTGIGMSQEILNKLFTMEKIISRAGTAGEKGSGLGLLICKELIEKIGGKIEVKSELEKGSEFIVYYSNV